MTSFSAELDRLRESGLYRECRELTSAPLPVVRDAAGRELLLLCSNNYLGLAGSPELQAAARAAISQYGFGTGGARLTTGSLPPHRILEEKLARFKHCEAALLFNSGYAANTGILPAIAGEGDYIFSDELNHASIIDGCRLSRAKTIVYPHRDVKSLARKLAELQPAGGVIVTDAVFSMDGDLAPIPELQELADQYHLQFMVDEAHSTGVVGRTGHGVAEHFNLTKAPDWQMGTLSKALGSVGGYVCASAEKIAYLRNRCRSFIFSTSLPAAAASAALTALELLESRPEMVERLRDLVAFFGTELAKYGIKVKTDSAIIPIVVGSADAALSAAAELEKRGILVSAIRYPTVPKDAARLRVSIMATHSEDQLADAARKIGEVLSGV